MAVSPLPGEIAARIAFERQSPIPDLAEQQAYAATHGSRERLGWADETDIQIAVRARMLTRSDIMHEAVCTSTRDRICALVMEKQALIAALRAVSAIRPDNWNEGDDPEQQAAWEAVDAALAQQAAS